MLKNRVEGGLCPKVMAENKPLTGLAVVLIYLLLILLLSLSAIISSYAQTQPKALEIGDTIPDITITRLHNYTSPSVNTADFRGKLLIIDFWATWCTACIVNFPKMDSLQKAFGSKLQVLLVTREGAGKVLPFWERYNKNRGQALGLPTVLNDTVLNDLFPHRFIPHYVWIGADGIVKAITGPEKVNAANIAAFTGGTNRQLQQKKDLDPEKPLFLSDDLPAASLVHHSILLRGRYEGLSSGNHQRHTENYTGLAVTNASLLWLYQTAAIMLFRQRGESFNDRRMIIRSRLQVASATPDSLYTYEILVPPQQQEQMYPYMLADLNRYSPVKGRVERLKVKCLVLRRSGRKDLLKSKGGKPENRLYNKTDPYMQNTSLASLLVRLNSLNKLQLPVVDETGYTGNADLRFQASFDDLLALRRNLQAYGLELKEASRVLPMLVISDKNENL
ncbi:thiol-disulfide isomerase/thioredoxin [Arcticibacter tournemirensis]|uniref:Redoxin domain-containing protein n=2 Tax=Arcticibacter tournemirensis TaxID=699437 RepID=A0A5M9GPL6_9SPHI|nr:redoxin domain-containing protein [Arcticibacter tournemirensis]TQM50770.1 thiol-disulfide isomerase/thioredoxin [Arcticibacter tournemirensis]